MHRLVIRLAFVLDQTLPRIKVFFFRVLFLLPMTLVLIIHSDFIRFSKFELSLAQHPDIVLTWTLHLTVTFGTRACPRRQPHLQNEAISLILLNSCFGFDPLKLVELHAALGEAPFDFLPVPDQFFVHF